MCAAKHSKTTTSSHQMDHSAEITHSGDDATHSQILGLLGKRTSSDTSVEKLRADTEESHDDNSQSGSDDVDKRERR